MPVSAQVLRICAVAGVLSLALFAFHGLPTVASSNSAAGEAGACRAPEPAAVDPTGVRWISQEEARALVGDQSVVFVDCRPRPQFESGHVSGALHLELPREAVPEATDAALSEAFVAPLRGARTVITYCDAHAHCAQSFHLAQRLSRAGLADVRVLEDGMPVWLQRGYPAESGACHQCDSY